MDTAADLLVPHAGARFGGGVYWLHAADGVAGWTETACRAVPEYRGRVRCFGRDWLGRQFALDDGRRRGTEPLVLLLDAGAGRLWRCRRRSARSTRRS